MDYEFWHSVNPGYTEEMWNGNAPSCQGWEHIKGGYCDRWDFRYGYINTYHGELMDADIILSPKVKLFIIGDTLNIIEHRYSDKFDEWTYCNNQNIGFMVVIKATCMILSRNGLKSI